MTIKDQIKKILIKALKEGGFEIDQREIEILEPEQEEHGDYATNIAFKLADKKSPQGTAETLISKIRDLRSKIFEKIEVKSPGFINFHLAPEFLQKTLKEILEKGSHYGSLDKGRGKKVLDEFISINPTGKLHIGHGRGAFYGDALGNILKKAGFKVKKEYYVNNAKSSIQIQELGKTVLGKGTQYKSNYVKNLAQKHKKTLEKMSEPAKAGYFIAGVIMEDMKEFIENKLKIHFDKYFEEETELYQKDQIEETLEKLKQKDLVYIQDQALWLKTAKFGDEKDRVIARQDGSYGYFLPDIAYHLNKVKRGFDVLIDIWGADHQGHKKRMEAAAKMLGFEDKLKILIHQMVSLKTKEGAEKMSKRAGTAVNLEWLIEKVGTDAARFMMLSKDLSTHMVFDLDLAKKQGKENPVYYVQYGTVRCRSILRKAQISNDKLKNANLNILQEPEELRLIKELVKFPDLIKEISSSYKVHHLPSWLHKLAALWHDYYEKHQVIQEDNPELTKARLALTQAVNIVLTEGLKLLGIEAPKKM